MVIYAYHFLEYIAYGNLSLRYLKGKFITKSTKSVQIYKLATILVTACEASAAI